MPFLHFFFLPCALPFTDKNKNDCFLGSKEMGFFSSLLGFLGFGIGLPLGLFIGFYFFIYSESEDVEVIVCNSVCVMCVFYSCTVELELYAIKKSRGKKRRRNGNVVKCMHFCFLTSVLCI